MRCDERLSPSVCISHFEHEILSSLAWFLCRHPPFFLLVLALVSIVSPSIHFINRLSCSACVSQHALYKRQATPVDRSQSITGLKHTCTQQTLSHLQADQSCQFTLHPEETHADSGRTSDSSQRALSSPCLCIIVFYITHTQYRYRGLKESDFTFKKES